MLVAELLRKIPGEILAQRIFMSEIPDPDSVRFLNNEETLENDAVYLIDSNNAAALLPACKAPNGALVICAGNLDDIPVFMMKISLIVVDCDIFVLHNAVMDYLVELHRNISIEQENLKLKFASIVENTLPDGYYAETICNTFPRPLKSSYCIICIEGDNEPGSSARNQLMLRQLRELFPEDNITSYDRDIVIIHSYDGFTHPAQIPEERLETLLSEFRTYAGVSNGMRKTSQMRMMYVLAKKAIESGKEIKNDKHRVFYYDDTLIFSLVSYAANAFLLENKNDDIIMLGSPDLVNIMKHDPKNKRELIETMMQYIRCGFSTSRTAEKMHLHRNTVQNRINMVETLMGRKLSENGEYAAKLMITYYIAQYYTKVWNKKLVLSPISPEHEKSFPEE